MFEGEVLLFKKGKGAPNTRDLKAETYKHLD